MMSLGITTVIALKNLKAIMKKVFKVVPCILVFFFFSAISTAQEASRASHPPMPLNLAHRGLSYVAPENTLTAFRLAIQVGSDGAECDVHRTSDGVLVLSHDRVAKRTMGQDVDITKTPFEEIEKFDAGVWKGKHFAGEKVPTLEEYLRLFKGSGCTPVIEIKQQGTEKEIVELVRKLEMVGEVYIVSFHSDSLAEIKRLEPKLSFAHIFSWKIDGPAEAQAEELVTKLIKKADEVGTKVVSLNANMVSKKLVDLMHEKGYFVWVWTVNDVKDMNRFLDWGLDSVTSDRPDVLAEVIKKRTNKKSIFQ